jgi:stage III sporulation protein AG
MSKNKKSIFTDIFLKIKSSKKLQYVVLFSVVALVIILILFSYKKEDNIVVHNDSISSYVTNLENRLSETLTQVNGAGKVSVVITVESGMETVLAMKTTEKQTASGLEVETTPLIVNGKTVVVKELYPKIVGVLIVAEGADSISVMNKIQQATVSLLDINVNQIEILAMK